MYAPRIRRNAASALFAYFLAQFSAPSPLQADDTAPTSLESGTEAQPIHRVNPRYPGSEAAKGGEGWVEVSFVVKKDGTVGDTIIDNSSGRRAFEKEALRAVRKWRYEPATMNGEPIERCHTKVRIIFSIEGQKGARRSFRNQYKKILALLEKGKLEEARIKIDQMAEKATMNNYENAHLWMLRSMLYEKEGDDLQQLESLQRVIMGGGDFVDKKIYVPVMLTIFKLEINFQQYAEALKILEQIRERKLDDELMETLEATAQEIERLREADQLIVIEGKIGEAQEEHHGAGIWHHTLLRRAVGVKPGSGTLERVELLCDNRRVKAKPAEGKAWRIPEDWGDCLIYVIGEPGSEFQLLEYASSQI